MEGLLCRWALAIQEYDFNIKYRKGNQNSNADALSCRVHPEVTIAATQVSSDPFKAILHTAQLEDTVTKQVFIALQTSSQKPPGRSWHRQPLLRFRQLWPQLSIEDGVLCRKYSPGPSRDVITVPVVPGSMQQEFLHQYHNDPAAGHQGVEKTLERLQGKGYWVSMNQHVERYCRECTNCQKFKHTQTITRCIWDL